MFLRSTDRCQFADVLFRLDDGVLAAHRAILMARCDMMNAMFAHKGRTAKPQNLSLSQRQEQDLDLNQRCKILSCVTFVSGRPGLKRSEILIFTEIFHV